MFQFNMCRGVYYVMDVNKIKEHLELALRPAEPPTLEEALEEVSASGVLRGPVDWAFPAWMLYVEYATQEIIKTFRLSEEEKRQLLDFRDTLKRLLLEAQKQAKEKLEAVYKAIKNGTYRIEGNRLYALDGTWIRGDFVPHIIIHGVSASVCFPDVLKLPQEKLELLQLGWRASDEVNHNGRPAMGTTQPWQVFAWTVTRYGTLHIRIASVILTRGGISIHVYVKAKSWRQKWSKVKAIDLVTNHLKRGEWAPLLTMWLGDGEAKRGEVWRGDYQLVIAAKEPWRLGSSKSKYEALVATGKEAFVKLRQAAGVYGELLDLLKGHKWISVKLATDDTFRATFKLKPRRYIDILRKMYGRSNGETPTEQFSETDRPGAVAVAGVVMYLELVSGRSGSLRAKRYVRDVGKALAIAERLESAGLRPNVMRSGRYYMVCIGTADLLRLAERDEAVRKAIALYLAEKVKNGTPRQRETAEKLLKRHPLFHLHIRRSVDRRYRLHNG